MMFRLLVAWKRFSFSFIFALCTYTLWIERFHGFALMRNAWLALKGIISCFPSYPVLQPLNELSHKLSSKQWKSLRHMPRGGKELKYKGVKQHVASVYIYSPKKLPVSTMSAFWRVLRARKNIRHVYWIFRLAIQKHRGETCDFGQWRGSLHILWSEETFQMAQGRWVVSKFRTFHFLFAAACAWVRKRSRVNVTVSC